MHHRPPPEPAARAGAGSFILDGWDRIGSFDQLAQRVIELNGHRAPAKSDKIIPASADLLPPMVEAEEPAEPTEPGEPQVRGAGRHQSIPQF